MARLPRIPAKFLTSAQLERRCVRLYGLDYPEALEMAYDNLREYAIDIEKQLLRLDRALAKLEAKEKTA